MTIQQQQQLAARLLRQPLGEIEANSGRIEELAALYVSFPVKGGESLLVGGDGSVLYADSSVDFSCHLDAFRQGVRTPTEAFEANEEIS